MRTLAIRQLAAWGLVLSLVGSYALPAVSARHVTPDADDGFRAAGPCQELIRAADEQAADAHCAICHWLRAISGASAQAAASTPAGRGAASVHAVRPESRQGRSEVPAIPSRAPPASRA